MKKLLLIVAVIMVIMSFGFMAYAADWPQFQNNQYNSGIISEAPPTTTPSSASVHLEHGGFFGIDSTPIFVTPPSSTTGFVYVFPFQHIYECYRNGSNLTINASKNVDIGGFQLCTPASDGSSIFLGVNTHFNQTKNKDFTTSLADWTTGSNAGSPEFSQATESGKTCAKIYENDVVDGDGYLEQTVRVPLASNVRLAFSFLQKYTGSAPAQHDVKVMVKREGTSTWNTIYTTSSAIYNDWVPVNENISNTYFPYSNQNYTVRFVFDYQPASGSTATCCFTDCQIIAQSMGLKKVTGLGTGTLAVDDNFCNLKESGQANTPLKYYQNATGSYLLLGNYTSSTGAKYFCINAANGTKKWEYTNGAPSGYYWAGAAVVNDAAIFGDEDGKVHVVMLEPDNNGNAVEVDQDSTTPGIQPYDINTSSSAHIRTTINYYDVPGTNEDKLYVVDYDGYLYQLNYNSSTHIITSGGAGVRASGVNYSTSSPVRIDDKVFYGAGGLSVSRISGGNLQTPVSIGTGIGKVQSSPVVYKADDYNYYIYVTENSSSGKAYCVHYYYDTATYDWKSKTIWTFTSGDFTLQGFAAANGDLYFGNDSGYLYALY